MVEEQPSSSFVTTVYGKQFRENFGFNVSFLETWRESTTFTWNDVGRFAAEVLFTFWWWLFNTLCQAHESDLNSLAYGQPPCKFCSVQHDSSEVTVHYLAYFCNWLNRTKPITTSTIQCAGGGLFKLVPGLRSSLGVLVARAMTHANFVTSNMIQAKLHSMSVFFCRSMDDNHIEQRTQWLNMLFYEVFVNGWDQFWVWDFVLIVTCTRCNDWVVGWEHQTYCMGRALFRSSSEKPSSQSPYHNNISVDARCLMRCECFNNKNRSRHRRSKYPTMYNDIKSLR